MNIPNHVKWTLKDKQSCRLIFLKIVYIYGKFQCTSLIKFSFNDDLIFNFYFDITLTYFLSPHFSFFSM
jgi:hypothetical protein